LQPPTRAGSVLAGALQQGFDLAKKAGKINRLRIASVAVAGNS